MKSKEIDRSRCYACGRDMPDGNWRTRCVPCSIKAAREPEPPDETPDEMMRAWENGGR